MSLSNAAASTSTNDSSQPSLAPVVVSQPSLAGQLARRSYAERRDAERRESDDFVDRRRERGSQESSERRQFGSSHEGLSDAGRELALAIDQYKLQHHRRYITCDEMLLVITRLGYSQ